MPHCLIHKCMRVPRDVISSLLAAVHPGIAAMTTKMTTKTTTAMTKRTMMTTSRDDDDDEVMETTGADAKTKTPGRWKRDKKWTESERVI